MREIIKWSRVIPGDIGFAAGASQWGCGTSWALLPPALGASWHIPTQFLAHPNSIPGSDHDTSLLVLRHPRDFTNLRRFGSEKSLPAWMRNPALGQHIHSDSQKIRDFSWMDKPLPAAASLLKGQGEPGRSRVQVLKISSLPCSERRIKILTGIILIIIKPPWFSTDSFPWEIVRKRRTEEFWLWNEIYKVFSNQQSTIRWCYIFWSQQVSKLGALTEIFSHRNNKMVRKKKSDSLLGKLKMCHLFSALQPFKKGFCREKEVVTLFLACSCWRNLGEQHRKSGRGAVPSLPIPTLPGWKGRTFQQKLPGFSHLRFKNS